MEEILKLISEHPEWSALAGGLAAEFMLRKIPKAVPILRILGKLFLALDSGLNKLPGLKDKQ